MSYRYSFTATKTEIDWEGININQKASDKPFRTRMTQTRKIYVHSCIQCSRQYKNFLWSRFFKVTVLYKPLSNIMSTSLRWFFFSVMRVCKECSTFMLDFIVRLANFMLLRLLQWHKKFRTNQKSDALPNKKLIIDVLIEPSTSKPIFRRDVRMIL